MKNRNTSYAALLAVVLTMAGSCKKDFLDVDPGATIMETNYYKNPQEAFAGLVAAYDPLGVETVNTYHNFGALNAASDDTYAGGGGPADMNTWQVWEKYTLDELTGPQGDFWNRNYNGVARANVILSRLGNIPGLDDATKKRYIAEAKFLRGYFYFDLVRIFKNVPLFTAPLTTSEIYGVLQAKPEDVYAQVEKDLNEAIPDLPTTVPKATEGGRATKGAAKALLGKVYLYEKKWAQAAAQFADVNGTPGGTSTLGYKLLTNFGDIFRPDNKYNTESIFEIVRTSVANSGWGNWGSFEGNVAVTMFGPRGYSGPTYVSGWSFNPITPQLNAAMAGDPRKPFTIANIDSIVNAAPGRAYEKGYNNTGLFIEKYAPKTQWRSTGGGAAELNWPNNYIEIRLSDTYLMEAEALVQSNTNLTRAADLLNAVRARVGLGPITATLDNIYNERRLELATEGHRWYDLVRTGRAPAVLGFRGFVAGKHEILPIPQRELNNTKLVQNPGYK
ncbi:RagB/SusD family nutrient uptake outer membrane protein [Sediminibacterium ginsengisoli]|uniref:Starch-binding associating with outer membrane n=1 Tax=Sediminibacterium ginsengisoli TaxID=413434 RepID=A0A1T4Q2Y2_9BACT|nr:RagB/SusD family nutrient uptake outer membrane protein [Sediminibacterium ginsengisoli]SJZ97851.1 Starch-binding associating with outer membrane [Sediminibacterium ginsengisoli]